jgi:hypothetical protein
MKRSLLAIALVTGFMFIAVSAFANPAMLKKQHDGYPNQGKGTTGSGESAEMKSAEDAPKVLKGQNDAAGTSADRAGNVATDDPRQRKHPGYPDHGVTENMIKDATKINANPQ